MAYQVLARKYRPQLFSDVVGQDHVTRTLLNALAQNRIAHGYIFSGHRGIGKTTIARILAAALNCQTPVGDPARPSEEPCRICVNCREISSASRQETSIFEESHSFDVEEIDAATNRGIDDARLLTQKIQTRPTNKSKYRIIILDEAHQITDAAWNALLKTLEEPPPWAVFMFATTQPEDIPQTIRSRCQHFSFHAVKLDDIVGQLRSIADKEHLIVDDATLTLLAEAGDGSMRDALSIMDQAIASAPMISADPSTTPGAPGPDSGTWDRSAAGSRPHLEPGAPGPDSGTWDRTATARPHLELNQVRGLMGSVSNVVYEQILDAVHANNSADVLAIVGRLLDAGNGAPQVARQFVRYLRNVIVAKVTHLAPGGAEATSASNAPQVGSQMASQKASQMASIARDLLQISQAERDRAARSAALFTEEELSRFLSIMLRTFDELGYRQEQRFHLELGLLKLVHVQRLVPIEELLSQLGSKPASNPNTTPTAASTPAKPSGAPAGVPGERSLLDGVEGPDSRTRDRATRDALGPPPPSSPFEADRIRKAPTASSTATPSTGAGTEGSLALADNSSITPQQITRPHLVAAPSDPPGLDLAALQSAFITDLSAVKGQQSASEQMEESALALNGNTLEVQTSLSKTMLPIVLNAEAERILKSALRDAGAGTLRLKFLPGAPAPSHAAKKPRPAAGGSAAELAERHPMVQQAKRIFSAEISNVIDLRDKN